MFYRIFYFQVPRSEALEKQAQALPINNPHCPQLFPNHIQIFPVVCRCPECGKEYTSAGPLRKHMQHHTGDYTYRCQGCDQGFTEKHHLTSHMKKVHNFNPSQSLGTKSCYLLGFPYQCQLCKDNIDLISVFLHWQWVDYTILSFLGVQNVGRNTRQRDHYVNTCSTTPGITHTNARAVTRDLLKNTSYKII